MQTVLPLPAATSPLLHGSQGVVRFFSSEAVPPSQDVHALCPFLSWYSPGMQGKHEA